MADQTILYLLKGLEENLPTTTTPGRIYYCIDTSNMYVDDDGSDGIPVRKQINALKAQYLKGVENLSIPGYHELYIDNEIISLGRKEGESLYEGNRGTAGKLSIAVGENSSAKGNNSSSFGKNTNADGLNSHAEGENSTAFGTNSHAEGYETYAEGSHSHAGGYQSRATGDGSFAHGNSVEAISNYSTVFGKFSETTPDTAFAVGNGSDGDNRSNAFSMDWNGNAKFQGVVKAADPVEDDDVTTKSYLDSRLPILDTQTKRIESNNVQSVTFELVDNIQPYLIYYNGLLLVQDEHYIIELPNTIIFNGWTANEDDLITISGKQFTDVNEGKAFEASRLSNKTEVGNIAQPIYFSAYGIPAPCQRKLDVDISGTADKAAMATKALSLSLDKQVGTDKLPVYFDESGIPQKCSNYLDVSISGMAESAKTALSVELAEAAKKLNITSEIGSDKVPIYFNNEGRPAKCGGELDVNISGAANNIVTTSSTNKAYVLGKSPDGQSVLHNESVYIENNVLYGAAWNDYAEYRQSDVLEAGRVVCENGDDTLSLANERLQPGAEIVSDTFGFAIGQTEICKTPIAVSGRVLVYPYEDRNTYKPGDAVCAAPGGTVSKMTREEICEYPERIVGIVSAIPKYNTWGKNNIAVNGRIWVKVK